MTDYQNEVLEFERIMKEHTNYMRNSINLIASENITSSDVTEAVASDLAHRYAEGQSHERLYEGCQYIDEIEDRVIDLSKKLFNVDYANVQPISGVTANLAAFFGYSNYGDKLMALDVPYGGHISHAKVSAAGIAGLKTISQPFDKEVMNIDIDAAHVLGLIAGGQFQQPIAEGADLMMGSTHKSFPGPQGGIILSHKENKDVIDNAVFPGVVSNHHLHHLAGLGIASAEMLEFGQDYAKQIVKNSKALAQSLYERGFDVLCEELGFTESHQLAINVSNIRSASDIARDLANNDVILNKNLLPGDDVNDSDNPSGLRIGTQEITRRGLKEKEMDEVAEFIKRVAVDKENIKDEVREFMDQYTTVHYSFSQNEGYRFHKL